ncbi:hypothetical protein N0V88_001044 [Collariella sp. IMI 366227]|nr:hypothetical protein N0V88_001044 [Collariella sp. IMI 366227]
MAADAKTTLPAAPSPEPPAAAKPHSNYKGFVAGVFSGIAKLSVGHPFDTIKVRLQTTTSTRFSGPLACLTQTLRNEGLAGLYKGATPPLVGWMFMDSVMLGSLSVYRRLLQDHVFNPLLITPLHSTTTPSQPTATASRASSLVRRSVLWRRLWNM